MKKSKKLAAVPDVNKLEGSGWIFREASKDNMGMGENPDQIVKIYDIKK